MSVYFIKCNDLIKIGYTKYKDASSRMSQLTRIHPGEYSVLGFIVGASTVDERRYHSMFAQYRVEGEWFTLCEAILEEAAKHPYDAESNREQTRRAILISAVALNMKRYRKRLGFTMQELADKAEMQRSTISSFESGIRDPSLNAIERMAEALNVEPWKMFVPGPEYASDLGNWSSDEVLNYIYKMLHRYTIAKNRTYTEKGEE
jgi:transcriptional regulator with XRE-family HTH domain